jgi:rhodanese-related sulfurtransferase
MKKRFIAGFVVLVAGALILSGCSSKAGAITNMNVKDFSAKTQEAGVVVIDVRTPGEFSQGHIQGAINIDVEAPTFDSEIAKLDKTKTYAVYCHSGNRSGVATQAMAKVGFTHLFNLQNGIADWMAQGMPTVTS